MLLAACLAFVHMRMFLYLTVSISIATQVAAVYNLTLSFVNASKFYL